VTHQSAASEGFFPHLFYCKNKVEVGNRISSCASCRCPKPQRSWQGWEGALLLRGPGQWLRRAGAWRGDPSAPPHIGLGTLVSPGGREGAAGPASSAAWYNSRGQCGGHLAVWHGPLPLRDSARTPRG